MRFQTLVVLLTSITTIATSFIATDAFAQGVLDPPGSDSPDEGDAGSAVTPPVNTPPVVDTPPADTPPVVDAPPVDKPIAVPEPPPPTPPTEVVGFDFGYDNGFFLQTPDKNNRLRIRGLVQPRFAFQANNPDTTTWSAGFLLQRAQLELAGNVFTRALSFTLRTEFGRGEAFMKDAFIDVRVAEGLVIRSGLWKRPFSRQQLAIDWRMAFFDRSATDAAFGAGRDVGIAAQAELDRNPAFEWSLGVFSGTSDRPKVTGDVLLDPTDGIGSIENVKITNVPKLFTPTFAGRIGYNFGELLGFSEMDTAGGPLRFGIAASILEGVDVQGKGGGNTRLETDAMLKWEGATVTGAVFLSTLQNDARSFAQSFDKVGAYLQAGVLLFDVWHPALRYGVVSQPSTNFVEQELLANVTYLVFGQNVLVGAEAGSNVTPLGPDARVRLQGQVQF